MKAGISLGMKPRSLLYSPYMTKPMSLGGGGRFQKLKNKIAAEYEKKGVSPEKAKEICAATAAQIGRKKLGNAGMTKLSVAGRKHFYGK